MTSKESGEGVLQNVTGDGKEVKNSENQCEVISEQPLKDVQTTQKKNKEIFKSFILT